MGLNRFAKFSWGLLIYTVSVILWGAVVRATGSGAGCGNHWPSCHGEVIPPSPQLATVIELSHRLTTSLAGFLAIILLVWAWRKYEKGHRVRRAAALSLAFMIIEGIIGALLVRFELVADNDSRIRAVVVAAHLANTLFLLLFITATAWWASGGRPVQWRGNETAGRLVAIGLLAGVILSAMGAVTALGDTLFPAETLAEGLQQDLDANAHFLIELRVWHPVLAILTSVYWLIVGRVLQGQKATPLLPRLNRLLTGIILAQLTVGVVNILLLAPVWLQITHLLLADLFWITTVAIGLTALAVPLPAAPVRVEQSLLHSSNGVAPHHARQKLKRK